MGFKFLILYSSRLNEEDNADQCAIWIIYDYDSIWVGKHFVGVNWVLLRALPYDELICKCGPCGKVN